MKKLKLLFALLFVLPALMFSQEPANYSYVQTKLGVVKIPGKWKQTTTVDDSGQTYLENKEGVIIAIAQNPKKAYPFYKSNASAFENVKQFYIWDADYRRENKFKTDKIKENEASEYIIWKYNDGKLDNIFLFGSSKNNFLNLMVYTAVWSEAEQIDFLEKLYLSNK